MSPNRIVTILTPLVFAPLAGFITAWIGKNAPGLPAMDPAQVTALFIAGATIAFGKAGIWLYNWGVFERSPDGQVGAPAPGAAAGGGGAVEIGAGDEDVLIDEAAGSLAAEPSEPGGTYDPGEFNDLAYDATDAFQIPNGAEPAYAG